MKIANKNKKKVKLNVEVDGPVRERAVLVNKNTDKLSTVDMSTNQHFAIC